MSVGKIQQVLHDGGLNAYKRPKKMLITEQQKLTRYQFAKEHVTWSTKWKRVLFCDECILERGVVGNQFLWYSSREEIETSKCIQLEQYSKNHIHVWGIISHTGPLYIQLVEGKQDAKPYCEMLQNAFNTFDEGFLDDKLFQHDLARCHTAKYTTDFLKEKNVEQLSWLPKGADISPIQRCIKNLYESLQQKIQETIQTKVYPLLKTYICESLDDCKFLLQLSLTRQLFYTYNITQRTTFLKVSSWLMLIELEAKFNHEVRSTSECGATIAYRDHKSEIKLGGKKKSPYSSGSTKQYKKLRESQNDFEEESVKINYKPTTLMRDSFCIYQAKMNYFMSAKSQQEAGKFSGNVAVEKLRNGWEVAIKQRVTINSKQSSQANMRRAIQYENQLQSQDPSYHASYKVEQSIEFLKQINVLVRNPQCLNVFCSRYQQALSYQKDAQKVDGGKYICLGCQHSQSIRTDSFLSGSKKPINCHLRLLYCFSHNYSTSQTELECQVSRSTVKNAFRYYKTIVSQHIQNDNSTLIFGQNHDLNNEEHGVEIDESLLTHLKTELDTYASQVWVLGIFDRFSRHVYCEVLGSMNQRCTEVIQPIILRHVRRGCRIYTDQAKFYQFLPSEGYQHFPINHSLGFGSGSMTTNHIESFWSELKRIGPFNKGGNYNTLEEVQKDLDLTLWKLSQKQQPNKVENLCQILNYYKTTLSQTYVQY
ncbi:hypothetical protein ABPG72_012145 [Tetrahymena utriculariae]